MLCLIDTGCAEQSKSHAQGQAHQGTEQHWPATSGMSKSFDIIKLITSLLISGSNKVLAFSYPTHTHVTVQHEAYMM